MRAPSPRRCKQCKGTFPPDQLNQTAGGVICNTCFHGLDDIDMASGALARSKGLAIAALVMTLGGWFIPALWLVPLLVIGALVLSVGGILATLTTSVVEQASAKRHRTYQALYIFAFLVLIGLVSPQVSVAVQVMKVWFS